MAKQTANDLTKVAGKGKIILPGSDPDIPTGPDKRSVGITLSAIRGGEKVFLRRSTSPLDVRPGMVVFVESDDSDTPLIANLPGVAPSVQQGNDEAIRFIPIGSFSATPLRIIPSGGIKVAGDALPSGDGILVNEDDVMFDVRYVNLAYGWGAFAVGAIASLAPPEEE